MRKVLTVLRICSILAFTILFASSSIVSAAEINAVPVNGVDSQSGYTPADALRPAQEAIEGAMAVDQAAEDFKSEPKKGGVMAGPTYEYDGLGRIIKTTFDTGDFIMTRYWGDTTDKYSDAYFFSNGLWSYTQEYRTDGVTVQYKWIADAHPGEDGDDNYFEYDINGRVVTRVCDDGSGETIEYYASGNKKSSTRFGADWSWEKTYEYFDAAGEVVHYIWGADLHIKTGDVIFQENDTLGRRVLRVLDNGGLISTDYWATGNRKSDIYCGPGGVWAETKQYKEADGLMIQYDWLADIDLSTSGDVVYLEYDLRGRLKNRTFDDTSFMTMTYWDEYTPLRYQQFYFGPGGSWQNTATFWGDGIIMHYQWIVDSNPAITGDVVYEEYDITGTVIFRSYDDGTTWHI